MARILHVLTVPESLVFLRGQAAFMRRHGHELVVITSPGPRLEAFGRAEDVETYALPIARRIAPHEDARTLPRLVALLRQSSPDIVHAHTPKGGLLGTMAATAARCPRRIYHMRGLPLATATGVARALLFAAESTSCTLATHVLAVSAALRDDAVRANLCPSQKIRVLASGSGNGVDARGRFDPENVSEEAVRAFRERLGIGSDDPVIGYVGRLVTDKGVRELAGAWRLVGARYPRAHLVVAGVFEERDAVSPEVRATLESDPRVHMVGFVEDMPVMYRALDVVVLPTYREGFPNVLLEAAAMARPIVASRVTGCVDAVEHESTGLLVPARDGPALADALGTYLGAPALREHHGQAGRARVLARFGRERVWEALAVFYDELIVGGA